MLQLENALDNLRTGAGPPMNLHIGVVILRYDRLLLGEITDTLEHEITAATGDLHVELLT